MKATNEKWIYRNPKTKQIISDGQALKACFYRGIELEIIENGIVIGYADIKQYD